MSQFSQFSEGGFSDIITDVDTFIEEHDIVEDVGQILRDGIPNGKSSIAIAKKEDEEEFKSVPHLGLLVTEPDYPQSNSNFEPQFPPDQPVNLGIEEYSGPYSFEVFIVPNEQKTPWEYSSKLNKIFIGINLKFPIAFSIKNRPNNQRLYVRATPVFSQAQFFEELVHRCVGHQLPQDPSNKGLPPNVLQHIIRCTNEETRYFGDKNEGKRLSIALPLAVPQEGTDVVKEFMYFVCKNSCPLGMNRKPIDVVFTLENSSGEVLGRRLVSVRICSCPKRDKEKEEKDMEKNVIVRGKRRRVDEERRVVPIVGHDIVDHRIYPLKINIVGKNNYLDVLRACRDRMAAEIVRLENKSGADAPFRKCYNEVSILINKATASE